MSENTNGAQTPAADKTPITKRKIARPFGVDAAHALMVKQEALRTFSRQECFDRGYLTVKDLDDEELRYGKCRDESGYIPKGNSRRTELIPAERYDEMVAEHEARFKQKLRQNLDDMLEIMVNIAKDDTVEPRDRFEASKYLFERVAGKTPESVNVTVTAKPWEELLGQVTGIAPMSRAQHRALQGAGIVDAEVIYEQDADGNTVQPQDVPAGGEVPTEQAVVPVRTPRPHERYAEPLEAPFVGEKPEPGEQYFEHVDLPVGPDHTPKVDNETATPGAPRLVDEPDVTNQYLNYGRRADEKRSYVDQVRAAKELAERRKEAKDRVQNAKKQRKIARALGAEEIQDEITGATLAEDGTLHFE
jgi:hypothetical protein